MSMGHEAYIDELCNEAGERAAFEAGQWQSKAGYINVKDMTDSHIRACMRLLYTNDTELGAAWYEKFRKELERSNSQRGACCTCGLSRK